ncbi:MAG: DNA-processing protein DprA [Candidatus Omnitrophica bacterium]|jgi:DNA processing protein|nr:DNA-processing protein DprA [Candidatus Omnitrophota bacterium]
MDKKTVLIILNLINNIGYSKLQQLKNQSGGTENILSLPPEIIKNILPETTAYKLTNWKTLPWEKELEEIEKKKINIITIEDENYPYLLKQIPSPPIVLYVQGRLSPDDLCLGIVGTRMPSIYGISMAEKFSSELACYGICIISGMARGIDSFAHKACLKVKGKTIAVIGAGFNNIYPAENIKLFEEIVNTGAAISEFSLNTFPYKTNFPRRNRIISGLSKAVLIIEAGIKSGALITAHMAVEQNRDVFVLPSDANRLTGKGNNQLIKEGAFLVENVQDIIENLGIEKEQKSVIKEKKHINLTEEEKTITDILKGKCLHFEELILLTGMSAQNLMQILTSLELKGAVTSKSNNFFEL